MANIIGDYPYIERVVTGFWSLDRALGNKKSLGWPMTIYEIFGYQDTGKTTFATTIAGIIGNHYGGNIIYLPIEHVDRDLANEILDSVEFKGDTYMLGGWDMVKRFTKAKKDAEHPVVTDEMNIDCMLAGLQDDKNVVGIVDSLTAINPIMFSEGSVAEMHMGRRAMLSGALARGVGYVRRFREVPLCVIMLGHTTQRLSMYPTNRGTDSTGGDVKRDLVKVRLLLKRKTEKLLEASESDNAYLIEGKAEKNSFSREGKIFYIVVLGGKGAHIGMTALFECKMTKLCTFGANITMNGEKYGSMKSIIARAHAGDNDFFLPFINALRNPSAISKVDDDEEDDYIEEMPE